MNRSIYTLSILTVLEEPFQDQDHVSTIPEESLGFHSIGAYSLVRIGAFEWVVNFKFKNFKADKDFLLCARTLIK